MDKAKDASKEPTSPISPPTGPIPMGFDPSLKPNEEPTSPIAAPEGPIPMPCSPEFMTKDETDKKSDGENVNVPVNSEKDSKEKVEEQKQPKVDPAIERLEKIKAEIAVLKERITNFDGDKKTKEYLYLDDTLTRHLCALDAVESGGREDIRQLRRDSIKTINRCLSLLDSKAKAKRQNDEKNKKVNNEAEANNAVLDQLAEISSKAEAEKK